MGDPEGLMSNKRKEAPDQFETHLEQLDNFSSLAHFDISSPHCLLHATTAGIQRLWDSIQRGGQSMDYERLQKLVAYVLKAVVISNYGDSAQLLGKVEDTEFEWLSTAPFPRPLTVAQALVGLALETRQGKSIRKKYCPVGQKRTKFSSAAALELTLAYCESRHLARMDGGPTHLWAISVLMGMAIVVLELHQDAPGIRGVAHNSAPHYHYYHAWQMPHYTVSQMRRSMEDPIPLDLLQRQQALGVTHLSGHWHHLRHSDEGRVRQGGSTVTAPNSWQSSTQRTDTPGNSADDVIDADAQAAKMDEGVRRSPCGTGHARSTRRVHSTGQAGNPLLILDSDSEDEDQ